MAGDPSEDPRLRAAARQAIEQITLKAASLPFGERLWLTCLLTATLDDELEYPHVRAAAARAIVSMGKTASLAVPALRRAADGGEPRLASAAAAALDQLGRDPAPLTGAERARAAATLATILESELTYPHPMARVSAEMLGLLGGEAAKALALLERASGVAGGQRQYERRRLRAAATAAADQVRRAARAEPSSAHFTRSANPTQEK